MHNSTLACFLERNTHRTRWGSLSWEAAISCQITLNSTLQDFTARRTNTLRRFKLRQLSTVVLIATAEGEYAEFGFVFLQIGRSLKNINVSVNH